MVGYFSYSLISVLCCLARFGLETRKTAARIENPSYFCGAKK
ncbi:MAG: hypothetical protein ACI9LN_004621 [Saprospiraceae bacterium]|jgi:hypothetical protein